MGEHGHRERLDVVRQHVVAAVEQGARLGGAQQQEPGTRARAELDARIGPGAAQERDDVRADRIGRMDAPRRVLRRQHVRGAADGLEMLDPVAVLVGPQHRRLGARVRIPERQAHHEAVDLRLGERVGALELDGVLRGQDHERPGQLMGVDINADAALLHALQEARLGLGRRAVDLVDHHDVREDRARPELEDLVAAAVDVRPDDVGVTVTETASKSKAKAKPPAKKKK